MKYVAFIDLLQGHIIEFNYIILFGGGGTLYVHLIDVTIHKMCLICMTKVDYSILSHAEYRLKAF